MQSLRVSVASSEVVRFKQLRTPRPRSRYALQHCRPIGSVALGLRITRCLSMCVRVSWNPACVRTVSHTPGNPRQTGSFTGTHRRLSMLREVVDQKSVGGFRCAAARVNGTAFQACSFNHSDISPHLESTTCGRLAIDYRTRRVPSLPETRTPVNSVTCGEQRRASTAGCVRPSNVVRSLTAISRLSLTRGSKRRCPVDAGPAKQSTVMPIKPFQRPLTAGSLLGSTSVAAKRARFF
jgi:hypothetical protein